MIDDVQRAEARLVGGRRADDEATVSVALAVVALRREFGLELAQQPWTAVPVVEHEHPGARRQQEAATLDERDAAERFTDGERVACALAEVPAPQPAVGDVHGEKRAVDGVEQRALTDVHPFSGEDPNC